MHYCNNKLLLPLLPLLLLLLLPVVALVIDGNDFKDRIEKLAENSLGVQEIQVHVRIHAHTNQQTRSFCFLRK